MIGKLFAENMQRGIFCLDALVIEIELLAGLKIECLQIFNLWKFDSMLASFYALFIQVIAFVGGIAVLEALLPKKAKASLAEYIFGYHGSSIGKFEESMIAAAIGIFIRKNRLLWRRVIGLVLTVTIIHIHLWIYFDGWGLWQIIEGIQPWKTFDENIFLSATEYFFNILIILMNQYEMASGALLPFMITIFVGEVSNLLISKWVYLGKSLKRVRLPLKFLFDIFLTFAFALLLTQVYLYVVYGPSDLASLIAQIEGASLDPESGSVTIPNSGIESETLIKILETTVIEQSRVLEGFSTFIMLASVWFFVARLLFFASGALLRTLLGITSLNRILVEKDLIDPYAAPLTFLAIWVATLYLALLYFGSLFS